MKRIELLLAALCLIALTLNALLIPFSAELLIISLSTLALFYMQCSTALMNNLDVSLKDLKNKEIYASISPKRKVGTFFAGISIAISIIGMLFYFQFWPGTSLNITTGLVGLLAVLLFSGYKFYNTHDPFYFSVIKRVAVFFTLGVVLMLIPRTTWLDIKYKNHPTYVEALIKSSNEPNNEKLHQKVEQERKKMNHVK